MWPERSTPVLSPRCAKYSVFQDNFTLDRKAQCSNAASKRVFVQSSLNWQDIKLNLQLVILPENLSKGHLLAVVAGYAISIQWIMTLSCLVHASRLWLFCLPLSSLWQNLLSTFFSHCREVTVHFCGHSLYAKTLEQQNKTSR